MPMPTLSPLLVLYSPGAAVTIVRDSGKLEEMAGLQSWWVGAIGKDVSDFSPTESYDADLSGDLVFKVCEQYTGTPAKVRISIHLDNGSQQETCADTILPYCDDDPYAKFFVNEKLGVRDCGWLARRQWVRVIRETACAEDHVAYSMCPETCGSCQDTCHDQPNAQFFVSTNHGQKDCEWLSTRTHWRERLCYPGHEAFRQCPEACDRCD